MDENTVNFDLFLMRITHESIIYKTYGAPELLQLKEIANMGKRPKR